MTESERVAFDRYAADHGETLGAVFRRALRDLMLRDGAPMPVVRPMRADRKRRDAA